MSVHECSGALRSVQDHSWELKSTHEHCAMGTWDLWVLITPFSWVLMSAIECSWLLMAPWLHAHLCSYLFIAAHECFWALMDNYEGSRELISCHKCKSSHHQPRGLLSMAPRCQMHSWPLIRTHYHSCAWLQQHSWVLIAPWQRTIMSVNEGTWVLLSPY